MMIDTDVIDNNKRCVY